MSPQKKYQVIVIGGGPAGSTTAIYLAKGNRGPGHRWQRSDRHPLQCGELVPSNQEMKRLCPKVPEVDDLFQTPENAICRKVPEMHLVTPSGKRLRYDFDGLVLDRVAHDEALVERAKEAGAEYLVGVRVKRVSGRMQSFRTVGPYKPISSSARGGIWILSEGPCGLRSH